MPQGYSATNAALRSADAHYTGDEMLGRLRLLGRRPPLQIPRRRRLPATAAVALTSYPRLSYLAPWPLTAPVGGAARTISRRDLSHQPRQRLPRGRFTQAVVAEQEEDQSTAACAPYLSVSILCCKNDAMALSEALLCFGASSASMDEVIENNDKACITSIFAESQDVHNCISHTVDSIGLNYVPAYEVSRIEQCNWMTNLQETFHPVEVTKGLWIVPERRSPVDLQATNIILNPEMAFGTGDHPTTMLCLLLLHGLIKGGECVLDYGTGSGVLGIAALKMGAALSVGIDIDPEAVKSAHRNMTLNGIGDDRMQVYLVPVSSEIDLSYQREKFEIVVANILLNPLLELVDDMIAYGKPGAVIGVSGILSEQVLQVQELYLRYLDDISVSEMDGWACLWGTKKGLKSAPSRK